MCFAIEIFDFIESDVVIFYKIYLKTKFLWIALNKFNIILHLSSIEILKKRDFEF